MGTGRLTVIDLSAERGVSYTLSFNNGQFESQGALAFHPTEGSEDLVVKWNNSGDLGDNPLYRWIGLVMDSRLGAEFEEGLANLKALAEAAADAGPTPAAEEAADPDGDSASPDPEGDSAGPEAEGAASDDDSAAPDSEGDSAVPGGEKPTSGGEAKAPEVEAGADAPAGETAE